MVNISIYGIKTLIIFYLRTFLKEFHYNTITTLISSIIFLTIIYTLTEFYNLKSNNINYFNFIIPGVIIMVIIQETFGNISANIVWMKHHGTFQGLLMAPISRIEIAISMIISVWIIGIILSLFNFFILSFFFEIYLYNFTRFIFYISLTSIFFGSVGCIVGFLSYTWELQQSICNFLIVPISLLSGTFFSIDVIDSKYRAFLFFNPFYYLISNTRQTFINEQIYNFKIDLLIIIMVIVIIYITLYIFKKGYKSID